MLAQQHRLRRSEDVTQVRKEGIPYRHPLFILLVKPSSQQVSRFAFVASRRVGNAVVRNRVKRLLREAVRVCLPEINQGWDCVLIARHSLTSANFEATQTAVLKQFKRAKLINHSFNTAE